jgi:hypothetical protein
MLIVEIPQLPALRSFLSSEYPATELSNPFIWSGVLVIWPRGGPNRKHRPNSLSTVAMGGCLAISRISLTYLPAVTKQQLLSLCLFRDLCQATCLYSTIFCLIILFGVFYIIYFKFFTKFRGGMCLASPPPALEAMAISASSVTFPILHLIFITQSFDASPLQSEQFTVCYTHHN